MKATNVYIRYFQSFNRTFKELKPINTRQIQGSFNPFNRTFKELKHAIEIEGLTITIF